MSGSSVEGTLQRALTATTHILYIVIRIDITKSRPPTGLHADSNGK